MIGARCLPKIAERLLLARGKIPRRHEVHRGFRKRAFINAPRLKRYKPTMPAVPPDPIDQADDASRWALQHLQESAFVEKQKAGDPGPRIR